MSFVDNNNNTESVVIKTFPLPSGNTTTTKPGNDGSGDDGPNINNNNNTATAVGRIYLFGKSDAPNIIFFCAGFPDDCRSSFVPLASKLATTAADGNNNKNNNNNNCLCGVICLPGYDFDYENIKSSSSSSFRKDHNYKIDGYSFEEWYLTLLEAYKVLCSYSTNTSKNVQYIGCFHDWGCVAGSMFVNRLNDNNNNENNNKRNSTNATNNIPKMDKVIYLDILPPVHKDYNVPLQTNCIQKRMIEMSYRILYGISFAVQRYVSRTAGNIAFQLCNLFLNIFRLFPTGPLDAKTINERFQSAATKQYWTTSRIVYMTYPYYNILKLTIKSIFSKDGMIQTMYDTFGDFHLPKDITKTPVLYMYGMNKRIQFHDSTWLEWLENEIATTTTTTTNTTNNNNETEDNNKTTGTKSKVVPVDQAGHWLYLHQPELAYNEIQTFICDA